MHPSQRTLREHFAAAYAAGVLDPGLRLMVEAQAALVADAARDVARADALAGALLEQETPATLTPDALASVLARLDEAVPEAAAPPVRKAARKAGALTQEVLALPVPARDAALDAMARVRWSFAGPGIRTLALHVAGPSKVELIRSEPGFSTPRHTHHGHEYTLVLTGAFVDERGSYEPGDIAIAGPEVTHRPRAAPGKVCYTLVVTDAPLIFEGALGVLQRLWAH